MIDISFHQLKLTAPFWRFHGNQESHPWSDWSRLVSLLAPSSPSFSAPLSINPLLYLLLFIHQARTDIPINQILLSSVDLHFLWTSLSFCRWNTELDKGIKELTQPFRFTLDTFNPCCLIALLFFWIHSWKKDFRITLARISYALSLKTNALVARVGTRATV